MARIAFISDLHVANMSGSQVRTLPDGCNSRLRDILDAMLWSADEAVKRGCTAMIIGGDITHNRRILHINALNRLMTTLRTMQAKIPIDVLEGNHDLDQSGDGTSTVNAIDGIVRAHTIPEVTTVAGVRVGWLPYTNDPEHVEKMTRKLAKMGAQILMAHLGIGDPKRADCIPVDYEAPGCIAVKDLHCELFRQVWLGHYHTSQDIAENGRYIGSLLPLSFKEARILKGMWTWDSKSNETEFVINDISPRYHIVDPAYPDLSPKPSEIRDDDFVWYKAATRAEADAIRERAPDRKVPPRIDVAPPAAVQARLSKDATTDAKRLAEYVRIIAPGETEATYQALVASGLGLIQEVGDAHAD